MTARRIAPRTPDVFATAYWGGPYDGLRVSWPNDDVIKIPDTVGTPPLKAWAVYERGVNWRGTPCWMFTDWELA